LPAGRVTVVLRPELVTPKEGKENWWQHLQRSRRELEAAGATFMNGAEVNAHIEWLREGDLIDELVQ